MKKSFIRFLLVSGLAVAGFSVQAYATSAAADAAAQAMKAEMDKMANDAAAELDKKSSAPLQSGIPPTTGVTGMQAGIIPGTQPEPIVNMTYDKNKVEGVFYGAEMPERLFDNVPSEWTTKAR